MCFASAHTLWERSFSLKLNSVKHQCPDPIMNFSPLKDLNRHASSLCLQTTGVLLRQRDVQGAHLLQKMLFLLWASICKYLETHCRVVEIILFFPKAQLCCFARMYPRKSEKSIWKTSLSSTHFFSPPPPPSFFFYSLHICFSPTTSYSSASLLNRGQGFIERPTYF